MLPPEWVRRWILDPAVISPGAALPSAFREYDGDHADLLVRDMFQFIPGELGRMRGALGR